MDRVFAEATTFTDANYGKYAYDNLGYNIYGLLLQNSLKIKWQDLLQKRVFDPARPKAHDGPTFRRARAKKWNVAAPYVFDRLRGQDPSGRCSTKQDENMQSARRNVHRAFPTSARWLN